MDWLTLSGGVPSLSLIPLGILHNNKYYISDDCLLHLEEIVEKLNCEDQTTRPLRCALGFMDILNKDLIPILINSKDQPSVFCSTIKLLVGLTVPVECLVCVDTSNQSPTSQHIVHELTQLLYNAKEAFLDPRATRAVIDHLHRLLEKQPLSSDDSESVNHSLLLIRNILHAPERPPNMTEVGDNEAATASAQPGSNNSQTPYLGPHSHSHGFTADCSQQNRLLWNLFSQGLDRLLINLLASSQKNEWVVTIVQLIALFYKDQHVENMQKLLGTWINPTTSESSEDDDESNTSPPIGPCNSPQILTSSSDPTSDSSDSAQRKASALAPQDENSEANQNESQTETMTTIEKKAVVTNTASTTSPGATTQVATGKSSRGKGHKFSTVSGAPGGDTASTSSTAPSQYSSQSDKSRRSSQHSVSSGFHSENSGNQHPSHHAKDSDDHKEKSSKRRCHGNSQNSERRNETVIPTTIQTPVIIKEEILSTSFSGTPTVTLQQTEDTNNKRSNKVTHKTGKVQPPEKEQRRKKLSKRSRTMGHIKMKAVQYTPTEEDISQLLKEFTVDFLLNGYNALVGELHQQLLQQDDLPLDKSHFLWLITYFLRFASQLELDMEHFKDVFTIDLLCYLTWEAVRETEEFEMNSLRPSIDLKPCLRRLHLGVTAIREYLQALETYSRLGSSQNAAGNGSSQGYEERICQLRGYLPAIRDLRQLFLLQLRHFNPIIQSRRYLRDVITANHVLLLTLERAAQQSTYGPSFDLRDHLHQFCSKTILTRYGTALEDFKTNGPFVNDCILTVLHHIGADLGRADLLCEPVILRSFSKIWEEEFNMCDDWDDLIEYVVQKFLRNFQTGGCYDVGSPQRSVSGSPDQEGGSPATDTEAQQQFDAQASPAGDDDPFFDTPRTDIESLRGQLMDSGFQKQLDWIQSSLLVSCSARLGTYNGQEFRNPIASLSRKMKVSCPIIPWTEVEASALRSDLFLFLLHRLGLLPPVPHAGLYPRIPPEWSTDTIFSVALSFGPIDQQKVDFDLSLVSKVELPIPSSLAEMPVDGSLPLTWQPYLGPGPSTSLSAVPHHWLHWVEQSGSLFRSAEITSHGHNSSHSISNHSHRPLDSISTTSSLEVHKTDSSDDEEMEDAVLNACTGSGMGNMTEGEPVSSNESVSMEEVRPDWAAMQMNTVGGGDSSSNEEMAAIGSEISLPRDGRDV
ncbi:protein timeless-like isoform X1 [Daphnia pulex]|uniref:protein timeless-like isoform X1 n=1 Tax=Daphnia pulex TaxID=6669 RepID=UPI001EDD46A7|nr:protein timeless-like isoform X1 [Daphnia pulex]